MKMTCVYVVKKKKRVPEIIWVFCLFVCFCIFIGEHSWRLSLQRFCFSLVIVKTVHRVHW
jgi:hypothetical protein